ncbi:hypothetical protein RN51_01659 [Microbacterium oxydans]|uniref:Uncharacterized protein n=1 Tax=Microbacterium oxydans TaxID=82380 RepID=A0A0F0KR16_9MICO|nr:hypothetical protein [Microbacterium oxydans]KJL22914.1 hypothetical protein RN51_01659 [Microbacterium oxydans]
MGTFTLTAAELHTELAEMQAHRTTYAEATGADTAFEMTACPETFERMVTFAARRAVYGQGIWEAEAAAELGIGLVNHARERRVQRLVEEATALIKADAEVEKLAEGFTINAAFEAAAKNEHAIRSIRKAANRITVGATAVHRADTESLARVAAARAMSATYTKGATTPFNASPVAAYRILAGIEALVAYLHDLAEPLAKAERSDIGFSAKKLRYEATDALDSLRYCYGVSREQARAARDLAAFTKGIERLDAEEQADAWLAREAQIAEWAASKNKSERAKASAAADAAEVLAVDISVSMDAEDGAQYAARLGDARREAVLADGLGAAWAAIAPQFGYADPAELAAAVEWATDGSKASKALSTFFETSNSRPYHAALARARALSIDAVRAALASELAAI